MKSHEPGQNQKGDVILEPEASFMERHGLLVAHSISCDDHENIMIQLLNPSSAPVTVKKNDNVGILKPFSEHHQIDNINAVTRHQENNQSRPPNRDNSAKKAIQQLLCQIEGVEDQEKMKLESLLEEFEQVISVGEDDLGRTDLVYHRYCKPQLPVSQKATLPIIDDTLDAIGDSCYCSTLEGTGR